MLLNGLSVTLRSLYLIENVDCILLLKKMGALFQLMCHLVFLSRRPVRFNIGYYKLVKNPMYKFMSKGFLYLNLRKINYPALLYMLKVGFYDNTEVFHGISAISVPVILSVFLT